MEIADSFPEKEQTAVCYSIKLKLNDWASDSYHALVDFLKYVKKTVDAGIEMPDAIGNWIWISVAKHNQCNKELKELATSLELARIVGVPISVTFHNWWKE